MSSAHLVERIVTQMFVGSLRAALHLERAEMSAAEQVLFVRYDCFLLAVLDGNSDIMEADHEIALESA